MRRAGWLAWLGALALAWFAAPHEAQSAPQIVRQALARITSYASEGVRTGTGFVVPPGYVVTAYHVVYGARRVDVTLGGRPQDSDVEVVAVRPEADLALLRAPAGATTRYYPTIEGPGGAPGTEIYVHGQPLGFDDQLLVGRLTQSGYLTSQKWIDRTGHRLFVVQNLDVVPLDITSEPGVSGAPVLDPQGNAFGVFSGSLQAGGGGYAWAVPLAYARISEMQRIGRPASAIARWPDFVYLQPGLSLLRSLAQDSEAARLAQQCRGRIDDFRHAWEAELDAAHHYYIRWSMVKPSFDAIVQAAREQGVQSQKSRLGFLWENVEPQAKAVQKAQTEFEQSGARLLTACYSRNLLSALLPRDAPATRENVLFDAKITRRTTSLVSVMDNARAANAAFFKAAQSKLDEVLALGGKLDQSSEAEALQGMLRAIAIMAEGVSGLLSEEQADYIAVSLRSAQAWAEIVEAIELHPWEREYQAYDYLDPSGVGLRLANGWIIFDQDVRGALLAPGKSLPAEIKFARFGTVANPTPPKAFAELSWRPSAAPQSLASDRAPVYWKTTDSEWLALQIREGATFGDARRDVNRIGGDLVLELTASARLANGKTFNAYLADRVGVRGTASLTCMLLSPDVDFTICTQLTDSLRLPR